MQETSTIWSASVPKLEKDLLIDMSNRLARLEVVLAQFMGEQQQSEWMTSTEFCKLVNTTPDGLRNAVRKGRIHGDAIKNIGSVKRAKLVYHRVQAADQYLNRLPAPNYREG